MESNVNNKNAYGATAAASSTTKQPSTKKANVLSTATTTTVRHNNNAIPTSTTTTTKSKTKQFTLDSMQYQQQPQQQHQQQPHQQLTNNIIVLRGSRNENGQIIIQNKHDIINFINEHQQQQQHLKNGKSTITPTANLTNLPTTTTIARKTIKPASSSVALLTHSDAQSCGNVAETSEASLPPTSTPNSTTTTNTILLQTPINASQLETVLLQSAYLKKEAPERPFLAKNASRSLSIDSFSSRNCSPNRIGNIDAKVNASRSNGSVPIAAGAPFVLQTLKRLEKSQSILVIRNSCSSSASASKTSSIAAATPPPQHQNQLNHSKISLSTPTTTAVSTNATAQPGGTLTFTRATRGQQTTTKQHLSNIIATNHQRATASAGGASSTSTITITESSTTSLSQTATITPTKSSGTPTYLRLTQLIGTTVSTAKNGTNNKQQHQPNGSGGGSVYRKAKLLNGATDVQLRSHDRRGTSSTSKSVTKPSSISSQYKQQSSIPLGTDGEPIKLPDNLESLPRADSLPSQRHRWNTNEEIAAILISFDKHIEWQSKEVKTRPKSGSLLLYSRKKVRYRRDGYCWKKRKDGKTTREDHMKLKVQGTECIYGCYVHSAILPTFHRRCYWLLQNPDIVLVHYLNVPYPDDNKMAVIAPNITLWGDKKEWTKEELVSQLKPMLSTVTSDDDSDSGNDIEISTAETVESIVCQLMEKQRQSRQAALVKQLDCGCGDVACSDGKTCSHPVMRRPSLAKSMAEKRLSLSDDYNQNASGGGTPNVIVGPKMYSRWSERRNARTAAGVGVGLVGSLDASMESLHHHHHQQQQQQLQQQQQHQYHSGQQQMLHETAIKFQIIPNQQQQEEEQQQHNENQQQQRHGSTANYNPQQQQQQIYRCHPNTSYQLMNTRNSLMQQQQQPPLQQQQQTTNSQSNFNGCSTSTGQRNNQINVPRFVVATAGGNNSSISSTNINNNCNNNNLEITNNQLQVAKTTITPATSISAAAPLAPPSSSSSSQSTSVTATPIPSASTSHATGMHAVVGSVLVMSCSDVGELIGNQANHMTTTASHSNSKTINRNTNNCSQLTPKNQSNELNVINNNSNNNNNYNTNYNQQQQETKQLQQKLNTSIVPQTSIRQKIFYKSQQKQQNDIKLSAQSRVSTLATSSPTALPASVTISATSSRTTPKETVTATAVTTSTSPSTAEPMCMSPEHHPSTPIRMCGAGSLDDSGGSNTSQQHLLSVSLSSSVSSSSTSTTSVAPSESGVISSEVGSTRQQARNSAEGEINHHHVVDISSKTNNNISNCNNQVSEYNNNSNNSAKTVVISNINTNTSNGCGNLSASCNNTNTNANINTTQNIRGNSNLRQLECQTDDNLGRIDFETVDANTGSNDTNRASSVENHESNTDIADTMSFFTETLDLSQEDIQRTLIANMTFNKNEDSVLTHLNFIDSTRPVNGTLVQANGRDNIPLSGGSCVDDEDTDDVFANLGAFDMLVELPEFDLDTKEALSNSLQSRLPHSLEESTRSALEDTNRSITATEELEGLQKYIGGESITASSASVPTDSITDRFSKKLNISDFSPEWSYTEGGIKVLVAGPWTSSSNSCYMVLFDSQPVPTILVQEGVLRCFCPAHEVGYATLQIACDGFVVSNTVMFEYKMSLPQDLPFDFTSNDSLYKFTLFNRLSSINTMLDITSDDANIPDQYSLSLHANLEDKLVNYCHQLTKRPWKKNGSHSWEDGFRGMTLLHLASAIGYSRLVCAMLNWRRENPNIILEAEIDALRQDIYGYTPMTWACSGGHVETATILYNWNCNALKIRSNSQLTPLNLAQMKGHKKVLDEIQRLENDRRTLNTAALLSKSLNSPDDLFVKDGEPHRILTGLNASVESITHKTRDGVFLRPVAIASNQSPPSNNSRFCKRSSIDSGINMDIRAKPGKSFRDINKLHSFALAVESPLDSLTASNTTNSLLSPLRKMDFALCEVSTGDTSPFPDKDNDDTSTINNDDISDINNDTDTGVVGDSDAKVLTLAEHIIAAMPERIKNESDDMMVLGSPMTDALNSESSGLNDSFMDPLLDSLPNTHFDSDFSLDFNDHSYRYNDNSTPCSSLSPASSGPLQSPASYSILGADPSVNSPSPPPSTKQLTEFLHASSNSSQYPFEADFSKLTLTDMEQRELYEAAKCIQKAYRSYKGRQKMEEQNKERAAAVCIQNYYRRYKQYAYYRQMTNAALVIQHGFRSYCRNKRFKKSQSTPVASDVTACSRTGSISSHHSNSSGSNSQCLSSFFDQYRSDHQHEYSSHPNTPKETSPSGPLKRTYSQSTQNQAARKIQQFMRQSRIKLQRERAEKEKLVHQRREEYLQSLQYQEQPETVCQQTEKSEIEFTELVNTLNINQHQSTNDDNKISNSNTKTNENNYLI